MQTLDFVERAAFDGKRIQNVQIYAENQNCYGTDDTDKIVFHNISDVLPNESVETFEDE